MKLDLKVNLEIDDKEIESWTQNQIEYYNLIYNGDQDKTAQTLKENSFEKAVMEEIWGLIMNYGEYLDCTVEPLIK